MSVRVYMRGVQGPVEFPKGESFTYAKEQLVIFDAAGELLHVLALKNVISATHILRNGRYPYTRGKHVEFSAKGIIDLPPDEDIWERPVSPMPLQRDVMATVDPPNPQHQVPGSTLGKLMTKALARKTCKHGIYEDFCHYCRRLPPSSPSQEGEVLGNAG